jgi:N-acetylneuraminic acid mutarotase
MLLFGGYDGTAFLGDGAAYNPATDTWRTLATLGALSPRSNFVAVWTGQKLVIWGGNDNRAVFNTGATYDPVADNWSSFSLPFVLPGRAMASGIWTGTSVLIWGGATMSGPAYPSSGVWLGL